MMKQIMNLIRTYGVKDFFWKSYEKINSPMKKYSTEYQKYLPDEQEIQKQWQTSFSLEPRISIVVPAYETNVVFLEQLIQSIKEQTYPDWQLCIADGSISDTVEKYIDSHCRSEERIIYKHLRSNGGIAANTNAAIEMACGEYICFVDHDDILTPNALFEMVSALNQHPEAEVFYSDEDKVSEDLNVYSDPHFKPDFNEKLLRSYNHICHLVMISRKLVDRVGMLRGEYDGAQDYDYMLRCTDEAAEVIHVPKILYHWRICAGSTAGNSFNKTYAKDGGTKALESYLSKKKIRDAKVVSRVDSGSYQISYPVKDDAKVIMLRPEAGHEEILNSVADYIVFVDENIELSDGWEQELLGVLSLPEVGMVGGKIIDGKKIVVNGLYSDNEYGIICGFENLSVYYRGYQKRAVLTQNVEAVSLRFAAVKKSVYERIAEIQNEKKESSKDNVSIEEASLWMGREIWKLGLEVVQVPAATAKLIDNKNKREKIIRFERKNSVNFDGKYMPQDLFQGKDGQWYLKKS